jgi:hypothetical protein
MNKFERGTTVYDIHGRAGAYVARAANGHIVEPMHQVDDDDEPRFSEAHTWREVFTKPPVEKLHAEVAEVEKQLDAARLALRVVQEQRRQFDADERARLARLKKHAHLSRVDDYIEGRITHFVTIGRYGEGVSVKTFDQVMKEPERRSRLPLLVLYGDPYADSEMRTEWCRLSDGNDLKVLPCASLEEATAKAHAELASRFAAFIKGPKDNHGHSYLTSDAAAAAALGAPIPPEVLAEVDKRLRNQALSALDRSRKQLEQAQASFDADAAKVASLPAQEKTASA